MRKRTALAWIPLFFIGLAGLTNSTSPEVRRSQESLEERVVVSETYPEIKQFLFSPFTDFQSQIEHPDMGIYALSNIAEGLVGATIKNPGIKTETKELIEKLIVISLNAQICPYKQDINNTEDLGDNGNYLTHLNIILGAYQRISQDGKYVSLNKRISEHLRERTTKSLEKQIQPFPNTKQRWPADQAATLYSLHLFDKNFGTDISKPLADDWLEFIKVKATDEEIGLPFSEITGSTDYGQIPRGCALSWTIRYMASFAPEQARELWEKYKKHFKQDYFLVAGFREWPRGIEKTADQDSGPIISGIGTAATALAYGAAKAVKDETTALQIGNLENLTRAYIYISGNEKLEGISEDLLAKAINFNFENMSEWY